MVSLLEDDEIITLFFERSESAIALLADKYGKLCTKVANNILNNLLDTEECVNDAYLGVWNTIPPKRPDSLCGYVCRIVRNLATAKYHYNTAAKRCSSYDLALDELENCFPSPVSVEEQFDAKLTAKCIDAFLLGLDRKSRVMFIRRYYYADSIGDIAKYFGTDSHYVSVRLFRIRKKLKAYLLKEGIEL